jgi:hypothetical protein
MPSPTSSGRNTDSQFGSRSFAVVGSGPLAAELALQLEGLRAGRIDLFGRTRSMASAPAVRYRVAEDAEGADVRGLTLDHIAAYDAVFVTDEDPAVVSDLNELCMLTGVRLVVVGTHGAALAVGVYPFGGTDDAACHACNVAATPAPARGGQGDVLTQRIAAGLALTLGLPAAMPGQPVSRRLAGSSVQGRIQTHDVLRESNCSVCSNARGPVRRVRTRNRWGTPEGLADIGPETLQQVVRLSDAIVTAVTCSACGMLPALQTAQYMGRRVADAGTCFAACPVCARTGSLQASGRRDFTLGELAERFGNGPAPVRYAVVHLAGSTICLDLGSGAQRRPAHLSLATGAFVAGFGAIEGMGETGGAAGLTFRPDEG